MRRGQKGFTLIELMIVVAIIGILAAIAIPNFISFKKKAIISSAIANLETLRSALTQYAADRDDGCYPDAGDMAWDDGSTRRDSRYPRALWTHVPS
jgi:type IV pilus assembly protein PilA